jgi:peptidyl-prolyl cis-trans isomerase B (cyclophilin B)
VASVSKQQRESREAIARLKRYEARQQLNATQRTRRVRDNIIAIAGVAVVVGLAAVTQVFYFTSGPGAPTPSPSDTAVADGNVGAPDADLSEDRVWTGEIALNGTSIGISLDGTVAPQAVAGFVQDFQNDYYPLKTCHRLAADLSFLQCGSIDGLGNP